jgi:DNA polymerase
VTEAERQAALDAIGAEVAACTRCRLHQTRTKAVPGEGTAATEVIFVGEGPGFNEDRQGRPFVGQAGALLSELLGAVAWSRDEVFITNVVKCRPPENRDPEPDEIAACSPFLTRQLAALDPALVVTLGRFSMARFNPGARIGQVHGTFRPADPESGAPDALTYAMYHPAAALHQGSLKATLFRDMEGVPAALLEARRLRSATARPALPPETPMKPPEEPMKSAEASVTAAEAPGVAPVPAPMPAAALTPQPAEAPAAAPASVGDDQTALSGGPTAGATAESVDVAISVGATAESEPTDQLPLF